MEVSYIDTDLTGLEAYPAVAEAVRRGNPFPIIVINGEPCAAGGVNVEAIRKIIEGLVS